MIRRCLSARLVLTLFVGFVSALCLAGCHAPLYYYPEYNFAGRATPPSGLQERVLATYTATGVSGGGAAILDGLRDIRSNVQNTITSFSISGYSGAYPVHIFSFPEQQFGYIEDQNTGAVAPVNYAKESASTAVATYGTNPGGVGVAPDGSRIVGAVPSATTAGGNSGELVVTSGGGSFNLSVPNINGVFMNPGNTVILATARYSNSLYRVVQLAQTNTPVFPPGSIDCEPLLLPVYCVVPVPGTYDRPTGAYFSLDGSKAYIMNSGPEQGGATAGITVLNTSAILTSVIPAVDPLSAGAPSPMTALPVANPIPIPGGVTAAVSDGTNLYLSGQSLNRLTSSGFLGTTPAADGLFAGFMTVLNETSFVPSKPLSVSDGTHTRMLLADNNTLWVGSSQCANGERAATGQNSNCLTMVSLAASTPTATVIPSLTPGGTTTVPYPNSNGNQYYYGSLTGICWIQNYNKVYTAYGGQIHVFSTVDGSEINNTNVTIQGTVLDVAYMDALTNAAN